MRIAPGKAGVRLRLTLLFGGLFLLAGAALLGITYGLVSHSTNEFVLHQTSTGTNISSSGVAIIGPGGTSTSTGAGAGTSTTGQIPGLQQLETVAQQTAAGAKAAENDALLLDSGIALAIMAAVSVGLGWLVAGRALRPLRRITLAAQRISATSLRERLAVDGPADDLRELADTIDGLFARLDAALDAQRQFVANASHELRTPLARSRTLLEVALRHPDPERLRPACERAIAAADEQERLIEALLTLARGHRSLAHRAPVDLAAVTRDVLAARGAEITERGLAMLVTLAPALLAGDPALTERAVANLIDNALRYNRDGDGGRVWVLVGGTGRAVLTVANTGPDVPPGDIPRLLQPFQRRVAGRAGPRRGLGLGLSIVQAVATAHGARLTLTPRPGGGLTAELVFPAPPNLAPAGSAQPGSAQPAPSPLAPGRASGRELVH